MLSDAQFGKLAEEIRSKDGFTIKTTTGERPTEGYSVSLAGAQRTQPVESMVPDDLKKYTQDHEKSLSQRGVYYGAWKNEGTVYHDNSRVVRDRSQAIREMVMENQKAIWHLDGPEGEQEIDNVFKRKPTTYEEPEGFDRPQFERDVADLYRRHYGRPSLSADEASRHR